MARTESRNIKQNYYSLYLLEIQGKRGHSTLKKKWIRASATAIGTAAMLLLGGSILVSNILPNSFSVVEGKGLSFAGSLPLSVRSGGSASGAVQASAALKAGDVYQTEINLFGVIPVKTVTVDVVKESDVIPSGQPFGVKLLTEGVMVVGMSDVDTASGSDNPSYAAGIRVGDILIALNGQTVSTNDEVSKIFSQSGGKPVTVSLKRNNIAYSVVVTPAKSAGDNTYKAGLWVRDSTAGIGTMTFYCPGTKLFAGLGHGVCDVDTGEIMPLSTGDIVHAIINGVTKGSKGTAGELRGYFVSDTAWGRLRANTETGVYGEMNAYPGGKAVPVAMKQQVHAGAATILVTLNGTAPQSYGIVIERVHFNDAGDTKNMIVRVTDPKLLAQTGGIVQGMSGTPIIQDGRLVGAITHVFLNDPVHGYGIFAENMLNTVKSLEKAA